MNLSAHIPCCLVNLSRLRVLTAAILVAGSTWWAVLSSAQDPQPQSTPTDTPVADFTPFPSPTPSDSPADSPTPVPGYSPPPTAPPDFSDPAVIAAYNAARTPQVDITVAATVPPSTNTTSGIVAGRIAAARNAAQTVQPTIQSGVGTLTRLPLPARSKSKTPNASATTSPGATSQPVATVVLTYVPSYAGRLVWVQMLGAGTLTADDGAGHTYDGSNGFYLTLDVNGMATFDYQAPNVSGTYRVLTRFTNVTTTLPFLVPDAAP